MNDSLRLQIEKQLAYAHKALWTAASLSESMKDQGLADDLYALTGEVGRINVDLLTSARPRAHRLTSVRI